MIRMAGYGDSCCVIADCAHISSKIMVNYLFFPFMTCVLYNGGMCAGVELARAACLRLITACACVI